ncbi:hypothetical protein L218DRAFT_919881 [Marasmius fiardii PR-910]|nr:hypothetical protein L218DRAFT_919881 [Marasmius fiardii PR-910]
MTGTRNFLLHKSSTSSRDIKLSPSRERGAMATHFFPSLGMQVLSSLIHFLGVTIVTHCLSRKVASVDFSVSEILQLPWPRLCLLLVFVDSWAFLFTGGVLIFGVGLEANHSICSGAILLCIACYATSKILIYFFLIERVHVVWAPTTGSTSRFRSPVDRLCLITVSLYCVVIALLVVGRISEFRAIDGAHACVIGLKPLSSIPLLSYDLYINLFLTGLFFWPLLRSGHLSPKVRRLAVQTLIASVASLTTSTVNITILASMSGKEYGWVCIGSCGVDVIVNAVALYWATLPKNQRQRAPTISMVGTNDVGSIFTVNRLTGDRVSIPLVITPPQPAICNVPEELKRRSVDHHTNPFVPPKFMPKNPQPRVTIIAQPELTTPRYGTLKSVSGILKCPETLKSDKDHPIEVTVTTHLGVEEEIISPSLA